MIHHDSIMQGGDLLEIRVDRMFRVVRLVSFCLATIAIGSHPLLVLGASCFLLFFFLLAGGGGPFWPL